MNDLNIKDRPKLHSKIVAKSKEIGFTMPSDLLVGTLLKTIITSKPNSNILELGTGIGLSLSWMIDGMDSNSKLISVDNDQNLITIASDFFQGDKRIELVCADGSEWIKAYSGEKFDVVFADAWPGKYSETNEILNLINPGGFYIIDDMIAQPNWPEGHQKHVNSLIEYLENHQDFNLTKMHWSSGVIIATKKAVNSK